MSLTVRPYEARDRTACWGVFYRAVREGAAGIYDEAQRAAWAPTPLPLPGDHDKLLAAHTFVAEREGRVVGFMNVEPSGYLDMAFVLPEEMGQGTAGALYAAVLAQARAQGSARMTVIASPLARRFFAKRRWVVDRREDLAADGQVYEVFHMSTEVAADA